MRKTYLYMTAVAMSAALAAGCQKAEPVETTAVAETVTESTGTGTAESESSETSGTAAQDDERLADYHLLQGIVTGTNDEKGTFTLKADDGGEYVITTGNIGDVETEIADDSLVVIGYIGVEIHDNMDLEKVNMVIAAPEMMTGRSHTQKERRRPMRCLLLDRYCGDQREKLSNSRPESRRNCGRGWRRKLWNL